MASGQPARVPISRRSLLGVVSAQTGLAIHRYGSATNEAGLVKGCVVIDVPQIPGRLLAETRRAFYGEYKGDLDSALESAAEVALRHLSDEYGIVINDWNYPAYVAARQSLVAAQESSSKIAAEIEATRKEALRYKEALDMLVQGMKDALLRHAGSLLPVRAGGTSGIEYVGPPSPPAGGLDRLTLDLVQIIQSAYDNLPLRVLFSVR